MGNEHLSRDDEIPQYINDAKKLMRDVTALRNRLPESPEFLYEARILADQNKEVIPDLEKHAKKDGQAKKLLDKIYNAFPPSTI